MPYVTCDNCDTTAYTAARFTTVDHCPLCGERLPRTSVRVPFSAPQWTVTASAGATSPGADLARSGLPFQSLNLPR